MHKDNRLVLSDIKSESKLRAGSNEGNIHDDDETNLF
jgi:hypothetical protein